METKKKWFIKSTNKAENIQDNHIENKARFVQSNFLEQNKNFLVRLNKFLRKFFSDVLLRKKSTHSSSKEGGTTNEASFKILMPGIILSAVTLLAIASVALFFVMRGNGQIRTPGVGTGAIQIYFFNPSEGRLYAESRPWPHGTQRDWVNAAVGHLRFPPNSNNLSSTWPDINPLLGAEEVPFLLDFTITEGTLYATFYESYLTMAPLQEALFRSAFTLTMVGFSFIDDVVIRVNEHEWAESAMTIANAPAISPSRIANTQLILYFIDESGEGLVREYYTAIDVDTQQRVRVAVERLIDGPTIEGAFSAIPAETRVRAVISVAEPPSVYVNLSSEFLTRFSGGPAQANLMIAAIVNTVLSNSPSARQVFFLIDSAREEHVPGIGDFSFGFEYNETIMMGYVEEYLHYPMDYDVQG